MKPIDKLAWIEIRNKSILSTRSYGKDKYYIPGGKREEDESDEAALCREIREELSIDIKPGSLRLVGVFEAQAHGHPVGTLVKMTCYMADYTGQLRPDSEIEEIKWLCYADRDKISEVDKLIFDHLRDNGLLA